MKSQAHLVQGRLIHTWRHGQGPPLVFFQGFGLWPTLYKDLFVRLGQRFEIIAPDMLRVGAYDRQPDSVHDHAEIAQTLLHQMGLSSAAVAGHSMGGALSFYLGAHSDIPHTLVALNPALPVQFGRLGFVARSLYKGARQTIGRTGGLRGVVFANRLHTPLVLGMARAPRTSARFLKAAQTLSYNDLNVSQPTTLLFAQRDEYFHLKPTLQNHLHQHFHNLRIKPLPDLTHDWPVLNPNCAARALTAELPSGAR